MLTEQEVIERLRAAIDAAGGQKAFAEKHGFTPAYVNDVLWSKRGLAERILAAIGVERSVVYQVINQPNVAANVAKPHESGEIAHPDAETQP